MGFRFHKLADKSDRNSLGADLPGSPPGTWPALDNGYGGMTFDGDPPQTARISMNKVAQGISEGWIEASGHEVVMRPAGYGQNPMNATRVARTPHIFHHYDYLEICGVRYRVTHQPDKYAAKGGDNTTVTEKMYAEGKTRVDWFYDLELVEK